MDQSVALGQAPDLNLATTLASLVLVIVIILFLAWVLKKMRLVGVHSNDNRLTIVKQLTLGQRERIALIQVGDEQLLVGITQHNISLLSKLEQSLIMDDVPAKDFASQLSRLMTTNDKK